MGRVWSSRGVQPGVARCTHAGPWLDSNLFVMLPEEILTYSHVLRCYKLREIERFL
jgi:hypothetical protein